MGTSGSSKGPGSGVPMVPPWVPDQGPSDVPPDGGGDEPADEDSGGTEETPRQDRPAPQQLAPTAPRGRFRGSRLALGRFARSGGSGDMRRGVGHYVRSGYGGGRTASRRFGGTASTANALYGALTDITSGRPPSPDSPLDPMLLSGRSAREVMDAIVEAVRPTDGTQDAEASRAAIRDALSELLTVFPEADLLNLNEDQRRLVIERFVASDVYRRLQLDLGMAIQSRAPTASVALARLREIKDYVRETVAAAFRRLRAAGSRLTTGRVAEFVRNALRASFEVFEGYTR